MINSSLKCSLPCTDVKKDFIVPGNSIDPDQISFIMISEAPPIDPDNYFYKKQNGTFFQTTQMAFMDAGISISSYNDLTNSGIYLTTAIKCSKQKYLVSAGTIKECSYILESELEQFSEIKVIMCMGDFAIKAVNYITKRKYGRTVIPSGSTYKIRGGTYILNGIRYFPSYTQTGESFDIEKSKRKMIAEDIKTALTIIR